MKRSERIRYLLWWWKQCFLEHWWAKIKTRIWGGGIKLFWYRLWIRKDESHRSLDTDIDALLGMNEKQKEAYYKDLGERRRIAHEMDFEDEFEMSPNKKFCNSVVALSKVIKKGEFSKSLDMDTDKLLSMNEEQREAYYKDLGERRKIAHERDFEKSPKTKKRKHF